MIELVEELMRVYADTPGRIIDFLSMASGEDFECEQSYELMTTLQFVGRSVRRPRWHISIEQIRTVQQAYKLDGFIRGGEESTKARTGR